MTIRLPVSCEFKSLKGHLLFPWARNLIHIITGWSQKTDSGVELNQLRDYVTMGLKQINMDQAYMKTLGTVGGAS